MTDNPAIPDNYKLEKRLTELERYFGKTRARLVDFMSLAEACLGAAAFDQAVRPGGGLLVTLIIMTICYATAKRLNLWLMRDG